jgi:hypothetical protein
MSLRGFHILLISLSSVLALGFGGWSVRVFRATAQPSYLVLAACAFAGAVGLVVYVTWFAKKVRSRAEQDRHRRKIIGPLALLAAAWWTSVGPAGACSVCYGQADGPLIDAARLGVWLLFGLVFAVQFSFVLFFFYLHKRGRAHRRGAARADRSDPGGHLASGPAEESSP